jgi:hypothetical protein
MKVYSALPDPSSTNKEIDSITDKTKLKEVEYPYKHELNNILKTIWTSYIILVVVWIDTTWVYYIYKPEEFFYPCNYTNLISNNDTLDLQARLNETQNEINSYKSLLSTSENNVAENESNNLFLKNATEQFTSLNEIFNYHKNHWTKCFQLNYNNFDYKLLLIQFALITFGHGFTFYEFLKCYQFHSKLKNIKLTEIQRKAYEEDRKSMNAFRFLYICKYSILCMFISLFVILVLRIIVQHRAKVPSVSVEVPYFN